jgi:hypothetical protein
MVAHPALLVPQKISVDEQAILPYTAPSKFNATPFVMAHNITFDEIQARVALYIWPHSMKISPEQFKPYDIPNNMFCDSKIISQNCPSESSSEENEASLLAMENRLFDHLPDSTKLQTRAIYETLHCVLEGYHFELAYNLKGNAKTLCNSCPDNIAKKTT